MRDLHQTVTKQAEDAYGSPRYDITSLKIATQAELQIVDDVFVGKLLFKHATLTTKSELIYIFRIFGCSTLQWN